MKLAMVGSGISGLVAAHLLHEQHDVTVFEASLQSCLRFYNYERAHHGYRTHGRIPAQIVWGARDEKA